MRATGYCCTAVAVLFLVMFTIPATAQAWDFAFGAKITTVDGTSLPDTVSFHADTGDALCPAGQAWLTYDTTIWPFGESNTRVKAAYSSLLMAMATGRSVGIFGNFVDGQCRVGVLYFH